MPSGVRLEATGGLRWAGTSQGGYGRTRVTLGEEWGREERGSEERLLPGMHQRGPCEEGSGAGHWLLVGSQPSGTVTVFLAFVGKGQHSAKTWGPLLSCP